MYIKARHQLADKQRVPPKPHQWVTVVNPTNYRLLLQACDDCGVVKSENSVIRNCKGVAGKSLISGLQARDLKYSA